MFGMPKGAHTFIEEAECVLIACLGCPDTTSIYILTKKSGVYYVYLAGMHTWGKVTGFVYLSVTMKITRSQYLGIKTVV